MSKGPGHTQLAILAAFGAEPDNAFAVEDLCDGAYPSEAIEKRHRVAILRALDGLQRSGSTTFRTMRAQYGKGRSVIAYDPCSDSSYFMAKAKSILNYRRRKSDDRQSEEGECRRALEPGGYLHRHLAYWRLEVERNIALRDGDQATAMQIEEVQERQYSAWIEGLEELAKLSGA